MIGDTLEKLRKNVHEINIVFNSRPCHYPKSKLLEKLLEKYFMQAGYPSCKTRARACGPGWAGPRNQLSQTGCLGPKNLPAWLGRTNSSKTTFRVQNFQTLNL